MDAYRLVGLCQAALGDTEAALDMQLLNRDGAHGSQLTPEGEKLLLDLLGRRESPAMVRATAIELLANYPSEQSAVAK